MGFDPIVGNQQSDIGGIIQTESLGMTFEDRAELSDLLPSSKIPNIDDWEKSLSEFARSRHWEQTGELLMDIYRGIESRGASGDAQE